MPRLSGTVIKLPSGNVARLRPVALDVLITSGKLPDLLTPIAAKTLWAELDMEEIGDAAEVAKSMSELLNFVCKASFLEPRVVDEEPEEDEIALEDIEIGDKTFVFQLATQPAEVLRRFRERQSRDVASVPDGESIPEPAE